MRHGRDDGHRRSPIRDESHPRRRGRRPRWDWLLLLLGLAGLLFGLTVGHGLIITGGLMVTTAALIDLTRRETP